MFRTMYDVMFMWTPGRVADAFAVANGDPYTIPIPIPIPIQMAQFVRVWWQQRHQCCVFDSNMGHIVRVSFDSVIFICHIFSMG